MKVDKTDVPDVVRRFLAGETTHDIAKVSGVNRRTVYRWMLAELGGEKYQEMVTEMLVARVSDADDELEAARNSGDAVRVSAAREVCRFARMDLERRRPALYGAKQTNVNVTAVRVDAGLLTDMNELLRMVSQEPSRVIVQEASLALPAPSEE